MEFVYGLLGTGVGAGLMVLIQKMFERKWAKADRNEAKEDKLDNLEKKLEEMNKKLQELSNDVGHLKSAEKASLSDRIKWLGTRYLADGEIEFEDRQILHQLHDAYHNDCGGNGDYKCLMEAIDELPLKLK